MSISDWSSDVCSSDLPYPLPLRHHLLPLPDEAYRAVRQPLRDRPFDDDAARGLLRLRDQQLYHRCDHRLLDRLQGTRQSRRLSALVRLPAEHQGCDAHIRLLPWLRSEEHTSELQSLMRNSYAVFCLKKKTNNTHT